MFGQRCDGLPHCGHKNNWACPCTCDEEPDGMPYHAAPQEQLPAIPQVSIVERLAQYAEHRLGCEANDLDPLDHTPCTCGLRDILNPWGRPAA